MATRVQTEEKGILPKLGHQIVHVYDLLAGPGMTEQERLSRELCEAEKHRFVGRVI